MIDCSLLLVYLAWTLYFVYWVGFNGVLQASRLVTALDLGGVIQRSIYKSFPPKRNQAAERGETWGCGLTAELAFGVKAVKKKAKNMTKIMGKEVCLFGELFSPKDTRGIMRVYLKTLLPV